jgi:transposase
VSPDDPKDARIGELEAQLAERDRRIAQLMALVGALSQRVAELEEKLGQNSSNSSRSPSSDAPGAPRPGKKPTGRRAGGQPGHKKHERGLLPPEQVQHLKELVPQQCRACQRRLHGKDSAPERHQVVEVPPLSAVVTEYRCHELKCPGCGVLTRAQVPAEAQRVFGERLCALSSLLVGKYRLSKRLVQEALSDMLGVELSLGSVVNLEGEMSQALAPAVTEAQRYVREAQVAHADETGWVEGRHQGRAKRAWLWVVATTRVVLFRISPSRGSAVAKSLLGEDFTGFLVTDRWSAYEWYDPGLRQLCWAHLTRDFQGFIDRGGQAGSMGKKLMRQRHRMFKWWHQVRDGTLPRADFAQRMRQVEQRVGQLLRQATVCAEKKTAGMAREILTQEKALWTFVDVPGVEPTNNFGERCIRHGVVYRKTSFGTQSPEGSRFVERILTAVMTLKLQERPVLDYLTEALLAHRRALPPPSLLPAGDASQLPIAA